jgi:hypothetical protein
MTTEDRKTVSGNRKRVIAQSRAHAKKWSKRMKATADRWCSNENTY